MLAVTYDRFEFTPGLEISDITLSYHLHNIITRTLISVLSYLASYPDVVNNFDSDTKILLSNMVQIYLGDMTGTVYRQMLQEIKGIPNRIKEFWNDNIAAMNLVIGAILNTLKLPHSQLSKFDQTNLKLVESKKFQLGQLLDISHKMGFKSIYILIDKIDETELTGNNPRESYLLIAPLIKDLDLLGMRGFGFKFFIWDKLLDYFLADARPDRVAQFTLDWDREALETVLSKRVRAFSQNSINSLHQLYRDSASSKISRLDTFIAILANKSPRNMIRLCQKILAVQAEQDSTSKFLCFNAVDKATLQFCEEITREKYGEQICRDLLRTNKGIFTINYLASNVFRTEHTNTSRNKVTRWIEFDIVQKIGTVCLSSSPKPVNLYAVKDPSMLRIIYSKKNLSEFFEDLWIPCDYCRSDNFIDFSIFPEGSIPTCSNCGREIV